MRMDENRFYLVLGDTTDLKALCSLFPVNFGSQSRPKTILENSCAESRGT